MCEENSVMPPFHSDGQDVEVRGDIIEIQDNGTDSPETQLDHDTGAVDIIREFLLNQRWKIIISGLIIIIFGVVFWLFSKQVEENRMLLSLLEVNRAIASTSQTGRLTAEVIGTAGIVQQATAEVLSTQAARKANESEFQIRVANAGRLAAYSRVQASDSPQGSLLLALESISEMTDAGYTRLPESEQALRDVMRATGGVALEGHKKAVSSVAVSPEGRWLASGSADHTVILRRLEKLGQGEDIFYLSGHTGEINDLAFSPDGAWLASGSQDSTIRLWDLGKDDPSENVNIIDAHHGEITGVIFSPDGNWLATSSIDSTVLLWNLSGDDVLPEEPFVLNVKSVVNSIQISDDSRWLVAGDGYPDYSAWVWELTDLKPLDNPTILRGHRSSINALAITQDGRLLVTVSGDGDARIWNLHSANPQSDVQILRGHQGPITSLSLSHDNHWLATGSSDRTVRLWDLNSKDYTASTYVLRGHDGPVSSVIFSHDDYWMISGSDDGGVRWWGMSNGEPSSEAIVLHGHEEGVTSMAAGNQNGHQWLITGSKDGSLRAWPIGHQIPGILEPLALQYETYFPTALEISPDSKWIAVAGADSITAETQIFLWKMPPKAFNGPAVLKGHGDVIKDLVFSIDGRMLISGSLDKTIRMWDIENPAAEETILEGLEGGVELLSLSRDGRWLASSGRNDIVRILDLFSEDPIIDQIEINIPGGEITDLLFSVDGLRLMLGDSSGAISVLGIGQDQDWSEAFHHQAFEGSVYALTLNPDGHWLAASGQSNNIFLWDMTDPGSIRQEPIVLSGHETAVWSLSFSPDGNWLASGGSDHTARLWQLSDGVSGKESFVLRGHRQGIAVVSFSPDSGKLFTSSYDASIRMWDLLADDPQTDSIVFAGYSSPINFSAASADGRWLITAGSMGSLPVTGTVFIWRLHLDELAQSACEIAGRNFLFSEWNQYFPGQPYDKTCPLLE